MRCSPPLALFGAAAILARSAVRFGANPGHPALPRARGLSQVPANAALVAGSVLVRNGEAAAPWLSKGQLLSDYTGAYTTMRTVDQESIFELSMHCRRLHDTAASVMGSAMEKGGAHATLKRACDFLREAGPEGLKPIVRREVIAALEYLQEGEGEADTDKDFQVTLLFTADTAGEHTPKGRGFDIFTYVQVLPPVARMVDAEAHKAARQNPTIKDVQWVKDRKALEELQQEAGVNEVVMFDADGGVTEGLQTNFFAIASDGTLVTAPDEFVLAGTVRKVVLEVAAENGIPVRLERPEIGDMTTWESCFIASTSRLVKPILDLRAPQLGLERKFPAEGSMAHRVEALVKGAVRANAEPITEKVFARA